MNGRHHHRTPVPERNCGRAVDEAPVNICRYFTSCLLKEFLGNLTHWIIGLESFLTFFFLL